MNDYKSLWQGVCYYTLWATILNFIALLIVIMVMLSNARAEESVNLRLGFMDILCEGADSTPMLEVGYEYKADLNGLPDFGIEFAVGGITAILHDTQEGTPWVGKAMGRMNALNYAAIGRVYLPYNMHIGGGFGYYDTWFVENYGAQADIDDEINYTMLAGWEFVKDWTVEGRYTIADMDIESGAFPAGILEAHSRLNNWSVLIGRKWRF